MVKSTFTHHYRTVVEPRYRPFVLFLWAMGIFGLLTEITIFYGKAVVPDPVDNGKGSIRKKSDVNTSEEEGGGKTEESEESSWTPEERACRQLPYSSDAFAQAIHDNVENLSLPN